MFDKRKFLAQMTLQGVSKKELAQKLGINEVTLYRKLNNDGYFTRKEINTMVEYLNIEDPSEIFLQRNLRKRKYGGFKQ